MIQNNFKRIALAVVFSISHLQSAFAEPSEINKNTLNRTAQSAAVIAAQLSKNLYKTETYQEKYTVQVPYETTETYTEQVPYQVQVPYTDYETDYRQEYQCHTVTKYRDEYQCHDVTRYRNEYQCRNVTRYRNECRTEQKCYIVPGDSGSCQDVTECGTNALGQQICKTRQVCSGGSGPQQRCDNQQVCENVPYTDQDCGYVNVPYTDRECSTQRVPYTDQECGYENVPYQKPVTKYRTETRYKEETRTRTVTKYRDEERCCVTKTREVFDRQVQFQANIAFPAEAVLAANESESLQINLDSADGKVSIVPVSTLYGYKIVSQAVAGANINVQLGLAPLFDSTNAGVDSIKNLKISFSNQLGQFVVVVDDSITHAKVKTAASIEIRDLVSGALIEEQPVTTLVNGKQGILVKAALTSQSKLKAILKVQRSGVVIAGGLLSFTKEAVYDKKAVQSEDIKALSDASLVKLTVLNTSGVQAAFKLVDSSEEFADVKSVVNITVYELLASGDRTTLATQTLTREQIAAAGGEIKLAQVLGTKASASLKAGKQLRAHMEVVRTSDSSVLKAAIKILAKANIKIQ